MTKIQKLEAQLTSQLEERLLADVKKRCVYFYQEKSGIYQEIQTVEQLAMLVKEELTDQALSGLKKHDYQELFFSLQSSNKIQCQEEQFDASTKYLCLKNGVLNCQTGKLKEFSPKYHFTSRMNVSYGTNKRPKKFLQTIKRVFPDKENRRLFLEIMAYLISPFTQAKLAFVFRGPAHSGKSSFARLISLFSNNVANLNLDDLNSGNAFIRKQILDAKLVFVDETDYKEISRTSTLKALIACENMYGEAKGVDGFSRRSRAKLLIATNAPLKVAAKVTDDAILSRFVFLPFEYSLDRLQWVLDIDKSLFEAEKDAIFTFLVSFMTKLGRNNFTFSKSKTSKAMEKEFRSAEDSIKFFINKACTLRRKGYVSKSDMYAKYIKFCSNHEITPLKEEQFKDKISSVLGVRSDKKKRRLDANGKPYGNPVASFLGIELKKVFFKK